MTKVTARIASKCQLALPKEVRQELGVGPGDTVDFVISSDGVMIERATVRDDPLATFTEWSSEADEEAYRNL